jgi:hypothetical protein
MFGDYKPRGYKLIGLAAFLVFNAGTLWMVLRNRRPTVPHKRDDEEMRANG